MPPTDDSSNDAGDQRRQRVLVTGATGYLGSRIIPALLENGHDVLAAARTPDHLKDYPWASSVEAREFDVSDPELIRSAVDGVEAVVYLVHSMEDEDFVKEDRAAAERMAEVCEAAGVQQIVYVSGLVPDGDLSDHLRSRLEVEQTFLDSSTPSTVLRAAMIVGSGSTSYELLRRLSERVPWVTPVPRWMRRDLQPVAVEDMVHLVGRALTGEVHDVHVDVAGDEVVSYPQLLARFAERAGLRRVRVLVPFVPQWLVGRACALIAGMSMTEVTSLVESLRHDMVAPDREQRYALAEPGFSYLSLDEALDRSLQTGGAEGTAQGGDPQSAASTDA